MAMRTGLVSLGILVIGIVLLAVGALIEPPRPAISQTGESLIAVGLTFIVIAIGYFLAWASPNQ